jgi:hypothetical protein
MTFTSLKTLGVSMSRKTDNDTLARLCVGLGIILMMRLAPRALAWIEKRRLNRLS